MFDSRRFHHAMSASASCAEASFCCSSANYIALILDTVLVSIFVILSLVVVSVCLHIQVLVLLVLALIVLLVAGFHSPQDTITA